MRICARILDTQAGQQQKLNLMKLLLVLPLLAVLIGCQVPAVKVLTTTNAALSVDVVGKVDGCIIYRFRDDGHTHYFVRCQGASEVASITVQSCGKSCTYSDEIATLGK